MKNNKKLIVIITIINIALITAIIALWYVQDRQAPVITFANNEVTYTSDMDQSVLYDGVSAVDETDGNLTSRVVIEKITENREQNKVTVVYAVSDQSGNVAKASRAFQAEFPTEEVSDTTGVVSEDVATEAEVEVIDTVEEETETEYEEELRDELKSELKDEVRQELEEEMKQEIANQLSASADQAKAQATAEGE